MQVGHEDVAASYAIATPPNDPAHISVAVGALEREVAEMIRRERVRELAGRARQVVLANLPDHAHTG